MSNELPEEMAREEADDRIALVDEDSAIEHDLREYIGPGLEASQLVEHRRAELFLIGRKQLVSISLDKLFVNSNLARIKSPPSCNRLHWSQEKVVESDTESPERFSSQRKLSHRLGFFLELEGCQTKLLSPMARSIEQS